MLSAKHHRLILVLLALIFQSGTFQSVKACPFCSAPSLTLAEQVSEADAVVLVSWHSSTKGEKDSAGKTTYVVEEVSKAPKNSIDQKQKITLARYREGKVGTLFLLMGTMGTQLEWSSPMEISNTSYKYITKAPAPGVETKTRLAYFLKFLEFPDQTVASDAYGEFANAPYADIKLLAKQFPRKRLAKWLSNPETSVTRIGLYGLLLGLCGEKEDAELMKTMITRQQSDFRLGIDGVMSGYLLLTGDEGLDLLDNTKLRPRHLVDDNGKVILDENGEKTPVPFSETYAAMQALRFMWTYSDQRISKDRLKQSMRILLDRPELSDLVVADLARWKDWSVQDRLMKVYGTEGYDIPSIKRAIVRYMLVCSKDIPKDKSAKIPEHARKANEYLVKLEKDDPKTVKSARRFFFLK